MEKTYLHEARRSNGFAPSEETLSIDHISERASPDLTPSPLSSSASRRGEGEKKLFQAPPLHDAA